MAEIFAKLFISGETSYEYRYFSFNVVSILRFFKQQQKCLVRRNKISQIHQQSAIIDVTIVAQHILAGDVHSFDF